MPKAIEIRGLCVEWDNGVKALDSINCSFDCGRLHAVIGESGAGKTTLLKSIASFIRPLGGQILVNGEDVADLDPEKTAQYRRETIGFVFQTYLLNPRLTACENVMLPMIAGDAAYGKCLDRSLKLLSQMGLDGKVDMFPNMLSGGEQQRVSIARALANDPQIILADEPTGNLDPGNQEMVFGILKELAGQGKCVITVSHSIEVTGYADEVLTLSGGRLI